MAQKRSRREYELDQRRKLEAPFVIYGTPLPFLDDNARDDGTYVPVWKQEVVDERGRKRLHGAFTGGFSAGYFNTVGSKEGWTPSTFISSRSNRAKDQVKRAEDFMDEEDLRERDEDEHISTAAGFSGFGTADDDGVRDVLGGLFKIQDTMGEQLLNRMGWKKGQGIGPRERRRIDPNDENSEIREFPPEDTQVIEQSPRDDTKGLGYETDSTPIIRVPTKPALSKPRKFTGIGVGSLNDTGSDEDPYELGPQVSLPSSKSKKSKKASANGTPAKTKKPVGLPTMLSSLRKCHDGKLPLAGFVLDEQLDMSALSLSDTYAPPPVPEDWTPATHNTASARTTALPPQTAESRRNLLGEKALPSKSVFDFLSPAARDRLVQASGNANLPPALNQAPTTPQSTGLEYPQLDRDTATAALARLRHKGAPYEADMQRQTRYKDFLRYTLEPSSVLPLRAPGSSDAEHLSELGEFVATAGLFRPVAGFLGSKFTSSRTQDGNEQDGGAVVNAKATDPAVEAARMGMFGAATRREQSWMPSRLVCKRFGVDMPVSWNDE